MEPGAWQMPDFDILTGCCSAAARLTKGSGSGPTQAKVANTVIKTASDFFIEPKFAFQLSVAFFHECRRYVETGFAVRSSLQPVTRSHFPQAGSTTR